MVYDDDEQDIWEFLTDRFAEPGGKSDLYPATRDNPRIHPCPTCNWPNSLTQRDLDEGYQCNSCADATEQDRDISYYED